MKRINFIWGLCLSVLVMGFYACSSDDNNDFISTEDNLVLEGRWQLETMNFLNKADVEWDTQEVPYNGQNAFGYAPFMFATGEISGVSFGHQDVLDAEGEVLGSRFDYIMGGDFEAPQFDPNTSYWYWNYADDNKSFTMQQVEGPLPPHDYSLNDIRDLSVSNEGKTIEFTADLASRKVGADRGDNLETPVRFTLEKEQPSKFVEVQIEGETFVDPVNPGEEGNS